MLCPHCGRFYLRVHHLAKVTVSWAIALAIWPILLQQGRFADALGSRTLTFISRRQDEILCGLERWSGSAEGQIPRSFTLLLNEAIRFAHSVSFAKTNTNLQRKKSFWSSQSCTRPTLPMFSITWRTAFWLPIAKKTPRCFSWSLYIVGSAPDWAMGRLWVKRVAVFLD